MQEEIEKLKEQSQENLQENKKFFKQLSQKPPKNLDVLVQKLHDDTFAKVDCLECANCCKTTSPMITDKDSIRIAKHLKIKVYDFESKYTSIDKDNFRVFNEAPCPFLASDNYCLIYDVRPKACNEYPHTNRRRFHQLGNITLSNLEICPATAQIVERLKKKVVYTKNK